MRGTDSVHLMESSSCVKVCSPVSVFPLRTVTGSVGNKTCLLINIIRRFFCLFVPLRSEFLGQIGNIRVVFCFRQKQLLLTLSLRPGKTKSCLFSL